MVKGRTLPAHLWKGRGNLPGPITGPMEVWTFGPDTFAATGTGTNPYSIVVPAPFDCELLAFGWYYESTASAVISFNVKHSLTAATPQTGALSALNTFVDGDVTSEGWITSDPANPGIVSNYITEPLHDGSAYPYISISKVSSGADTDYCTVWLVLCRLEHIHTDPAND